MARLAARQSDAYVKKRGRKASKPPAERPREDLNPSDEGGNPPDDGDEDTRIRARLDAIWKAAKSDDPAESLRLYHDAFQEFLAQDGITSSIEQPMDSRFRSTLEAKASASIQKHKDRMVRAHVKALGGHPWCLSLLQVWGLYALDNAWPGSTLLGWLRDLSSAEQDAAEAHSLLKIARASRALDRQARQLREHRLEPRGKWQAWMSTDVRNAIEAWLGQDERRSWEHLTNYRKDKAFQKARKQTGGSTASEKAGGNAGEEEAEHVSEQEAGDGGTIREEDDGHVPSPERGRRGDTGDGEPPAEDSLFDDGGLSGFGNDDTTDLGNANAHTSTPRLSIRRSISQSRRSMSRSPSFAYLHRRSGSLGTCTGDRLSFAPRNRGSVGDDWRLPPTTPTTKTPTPPTPPTEPQCQRPTAFTRAATDLHTEDEDTLASCPTMASALPPAKRPRLEPSKSLQPWLDTFAPSHNSTAPIELLNHAGVDSALVDDTASGLALIVLRLTDTQLRTRCALVELTGEASIAHVNELDMVTNTSSNFHLGKIVRSLRDLVPALAPRQEQAEGEHTQEPEVEFVALPLLEAQADDIVRIAILVSHKLTLSLDKMPTEIHDFAVWQYATALCAAQSPPTTTNARPPPCPTRPVLDGDTPAPIRAQAPFNPEATTSCTAVREFVQTWTERADQLEQASIEAGRIWGILHEFQQGQDNQSGDKHTLWWKIAETQGLIRQTQANLAKSSLDSELRGMESDRLQSLEARLLKQQETRSKSARWDRRQAVINQLANDRLHYQLEKEQAKIGLEEMREEWKKFAASL